MSSKEAYINYSNALHAGNFEQANSLLPTISSRRMEFHLGRIKQIAGVSDPVLVANSLLLSKGNTREGAIFYLPDEIGQSIIEVPVPSQSIRDALATILSQTGTSTLRLEQMDLALERSLGGTEAGEELLFRNGISIRASEYGDFAGTFQSISNGSATATDIVHTLVWLHQEQRPLRVTRRTDVNMPFPPGNGFRIRAIEDFTQSVWNSLFAACLLARYISYDVIENGQLEQKNIVQIYYPTHGDESAIIQSIPADRYIQFVANMRQFLTSQQLKLLDDTIKMAKVLHSDYPAILLTDSSRKSTQEMQAEVFERIERNFSIENGDPSGRLANNSVFLRLKPEESLMKGVFSFQDLFRYASFKTGVPIEEIYLESTIDIQKDLWAISRDISGYYSGNPFTITTPQGVTYPISSMINADGYRVPLAQCGIEVDYGYHQQMMIGMVGYFDGHEFMPRIRGDVIQEGYRRRDAALLAQNLHIGRIRANEINEVVGTEFFELIIFPS